MQIGKEEIKLCLFANDVTVYIEKLKESIKEERKEKPFKTKEWIKKGCRIYNWHTEINYIFYILKTDLWKQRLKTPCRLQFCPRKWQYSGINLTNHAEDLHAENYKLMIEEIKQYLN